MERNSERTSVHGLARTMTLTRRIQERVKQREEERLQHDQEKELKNGVELEKELDKIENADKVNARNSATILNGGKVDPESGKPKSHHHEIIDKLKKAIGMHFSKVTAEIEQHGPSPKALLELKVVLAPKWAH
jgi:hypothetical protein